MTDVTGASVSFTPTSDHDADSFYEVRLTATDAGGRSDTKVIQLQPETREVTIDSSPQGAPIEWADEGQIAPAVRTTAIGYRPTISLEDGLAALIDLTRREAPEAVDRTEASSAQLAERGLVV